MLLTNVTHFKSISFMHQHFSQFVVVVQMNHTGWTWRLGFGWGKGGVNVVGGVELSRKIRAVAEALQSFLHLVLTKIAPITTSSLKTLMASWTQEQGP